MPYDASIDPWNEPELSQPAAAATVIGCLKYGAGVCGVHVSNQAAEVFLKDGSLNDGPDDEAFLQSLRRSLKTARGAYPPVALAEIYQEYKSPLTKIRRLHLMVVDLGRSRCVSPQVYQDFMNCRVSLDPAGSLNTLPVPISGKDCPFQMRYVFAYGVDNSDRPSSAFFFSSLAERAITAVPVTALL